MKAQRELLRPLKRISGTIGYGWKIFASSIKGWHRSLATTFTMFHPPLGFFIQTLREELLRQQTQALRILRGMEQIRERDADVIATENRVISAKTALQNFLDDNNNVIYIEAMKSLHQARNCASILPIENHDEGDDSILILDDNLLEFIG